jgi:hypothetical protein
VLRVIDDKDKSLMGEEKDPFESIVDLDNDPFEKQQSTSYVIPEEKPKPKRVKKPKNTVVEDDFFNPISHKDEDQVEEVEPHGRKAYGIVFLVIFVSMFGLQMLMFLFSLLFDWLGEIS